MRLLIGLLFVASSASAGTGCVNREVVLEAPLKSAEAIRARFAVLSHLPYEVRVTPRGNDAEIAIGYRRLTPGDRYGEPLSPELGKRVFDILGSDFKALGVRRLRLEYLPLRPC